MSGRYRHRPTDWPTDSLEERRAHGGYLEGATDRQTSSQGGEVILGLKLAPKLEAISGPKIGPRVGRVGGSDRPTDWQPGEGDQEIGGRRAGIDRPTDRLTDERGQGSTDRPTDWQPGEGDHEMKAGRRAAGIDRPTDRLTAWGGRSWDERGQGAWAQLPVGQSVGRSAAEPFWSYRATRRTSSNFVFENRFRLTLPISLSLHLCLARWNGWSGFKSTLLPVWQKIKVLVIIKLKI